MTQSKISIKINLRTPEEGSAIQMCGNIYCLEVTASGEGKLCKIVKKIRQSGRYGINRREALPKSK